MNHEHVEEELLQRYCDGELRPARAAEVRQHLERCDACQQRQRSLALLGNIIERAGHESGRDVDFDALYASIERGIRTAREPGLGERLAVWWRDLREQRPQQLWVPLASAVAAASVLLIVFRGELGQDEAAAGTRTAATPSGQSHEAASANQTATSSEVVQVDFGSNPGTVYEIALADGVSTPVVWINDDM